MAVAPHDRDILRGLASQVADIASLPVHAVTIEGWKRLNELRPTKPMIWINEVPWHEMNVNGELNLECTDPFCRQHEEALRRTLYQWRYLRADMVVEPVYYCPLVVHDSGLGIDEDVDIIRTDESSSIVSRRFHPQINDDSDLEKIKMPVVTYDAAATEANYEALQALFGDMLPVVKRGVPGFFFAPWDFLIRLYTVEQAMLDLVLRPALVHQAMERLLQAYLCGLDQYEQQGLLALNNTNVRVGSGGLGYTDELPAEGFNPARVRTADMWGFATAQIFSEVSPAMHEEFALQYERRWLERFGLNYYGCCEPLHGKIPILRSIPRLRKISISPKADVEAAAAQIGRDYVMSIKPNPAILAGEGWNSEAICNDLRSTLEKAKGCTVEVIMKDISTVRYRPERLWDWSRLAAEVSADFA